MPTIRPTVPLPMEHDGRDDARLDLATEIARDLIPAHLQAKVGRAMVWYYARRVLSAIVSRGWVLIPRSQYDRLVLQQHAVAASRPSVVGLVGDDGR